MKMPCSAIGLLRLSDCRMTTLLLSSNTSTMTNNNSLEDELPPFKEYIMSNLGNGKGSLTLLRRHQVLHLLGEDYDLSKLKPVLELSVPAVGGPTKTPLYDWVEVQLILRTRNLRGK